MRVSVVIVTRNRAQELMRCLQSVIAQDYADMEIIVVDNDSSDDTAARLRQAYPDILLLPQQRNTGAPEGRNIGIMRATGELILCIDDDAELTDAQAVSKGVHYFAQDTLLACLSFLVLDLHGQVVRKLIPRRDRKRIAHDTEAAMFAATGCMLRRAAFIDAGGFWEKLNPYFGEEPELSYRLLDKGYRLLMTPHIAVRHYESMNERCSSRRLYFGVRNTPWLALRNLPWHAVISLTTLAWGYFLLIAITHGQLRVFLSAARASITGLPGIYRGRKPIGRHARALLWRHSGLYMF